MLDFSSFISLPVVWAIIIGIAVLLYVLLDGFDLGIGILFPFAPSEECRIKMMNSVAPFWDGNETWLVLGGGGLLAAFPLAYSVIMPALYLPIILMLIGLIFRGVAFEFRFKSPENQIKMWNISFHVGSLLAAFMQGVILGNVVQGIEVTGRAFSGGAWDWANSFSLLNGIAVVFGYALQGATWTIMKTADQTQKWAQTITTYLLSFVVLFVLIVAVCMPFVNVAQIRNFWITSPWVFLLSFICIVSFAFVILILKDVIQKKREYRPFILSTSLFLLGYIVLGLSLWPWIVPYQFTIWQAAAASTSLSLLLIGTSLFLPLILCYVAYSYYVFRGKAKETPLY